MNKHILMGPDTYPLESIKLHNVWFAGRDVAKQRNEVILHDLREVTSESQVISHDPPVTSMVLNSGIR